MPSLVDSSRPPGRYEPRSDDKVSLKRGDHESADRSYLVLGFLELLANDVFFQCET